MEQIEDFIANCVHSVWYSWRGGPERADMEKLPDKLFWKAANPASRQHENTHEFYVANPQNPSVDV